MFALEFDGRLLHLPTAGRELAGHRVERFGQRTELVVALRLEVLIEPAGANLARGRGQHQTGWVMRFAR